MFAAQNCKASSSAQVGQYLRAESYLTAHLGHCSDVSSSSLDQDCSCGCAWQAWLVFVPVQLLEGLKPALPVYMQYWQHRREEATACVRVLFSCQDCWARSSGGRGEGTARSAADDADRRDRKA